MRKFAVSSGFPVKRGFILLFTTLVFCGFISAQTLQTQSFDDAAFPPAGWTQAGGNTSYLTRVTSGMDPTQNPHSGTGEVQFNSSNLIGGTTLLIGPQVDWSNRGSNTPTISFWFYRDASYNTSAFDSEGVLLLVNTSPAVAGAIPLLFVPRPISAAPAVNSAGWYQYSANVPLQFNTSTNYFIFQFQSYNGDNCYMDDVAWIVYASSCTGTPAPGNVLSTVNPVCVGTAFSLSLQNSLPSVGSTYQWQNSLDSFTWSDMTGDTVATVTGLSIVGITYYRCITGCSLSGLKDTTPVFTQAIGTTTCYCIPDTSYCSADLITNLSYGGINNNTPNCDSLGYAAYNLTAMVRKEISSPISITVSDGGDEYTAVWIDYNHNGVYEPSEFTFIDSGEGGVTFTNNIYIPGNALTGVTGMRVRIQNGTALTDTDACDTIFLGETQDYWVNILAPPACTNPPVAGTISGDSLLCPGYSTTLALNGQSSGTDVQWQTSTDSLTWTNIPGQQDILYNSPPLYVKTFYRVKVNCTDTVYTNVITVNLNPINLCYCVEPELGGSAFCPSPFVISGVSITGTTLNTGSVCDLSTGYDYHLFAAVGDSTATLYPSLAYTINVACSDVNGSLTGWIDFNQDGIYEPWENILLTNNTTATVQSFIFAVPDTALTGTTGMRIRSTDFQLTDSDACAGTFLGETEDYVITIQPLPPCTNPPVAGTIEGMHNICPDDTETLSLMGETLGTSFLWQYSTDSVTWHDIPGADEAIFSIENITDSVWLRVRVNCADTVYTPAFGVYAKASYTCYCGEPGIAGGTSCTSTYLIDTFGISCTPLNTTNVCNITDGYLYTQFPVSGNSTATLYIGHAYQFNVSCLNAGTGVAAWLDFSHSGFNFSDNIFDYQSATGSVQSSYFIIPNSSLPGLTGLRVRSNPFGLQTTDACTNEFDGQTLDYLVTLLRAPACNGLPEAGAITGTASACPGNGVLLLCGETIGVQIQWQISDDSLNWTNIPGAQFELFYPTDSNVAYYRVKVSCDDSAAYTAGFKLSVNPFYLCYCQPGSGYCGFGDEITNVTFAGINNTAGCPANGYAQYPSPVAWVAPGTSPVISVTVGNPTYDSVGVWLDYNRNGLFDPWEYTYVGGSSIGGPIIADILIPDSALPGITGMRVQVNGNNLPGDSDACNSPALGEIEDYLVNIAGAQSCVISSVGGTVRGPASGTAGVAYHYIDSGEVGSVQWRYSNSSATGPFTPIPGATGATLSYSFLFPGTYWVSALVQSQSCPPDSSNAVETVIIFKGDSVCSAIPIYFAPAAPGGVNGPFNTTYAVVEAGEPAPPATGCNTQTGWCNSVLHNTLWFTFSAPASGRIRVQTPGFDTKLAVWSADDCDTILHNGATLLAANDNDPDYAAHGGVLGSSYIDSIICLTPGITYYVQLGATTSPGGSTTVILTDLGIGASTIIANSTVNNQYQNGAYGSISLSASGSVAPYHYQWNDGATTSSISNLAAGIYICTITSAQGCSFIVSDTVKFISGINNLNNSFTVNIYPNPAQNDVLVDIQADVVNDMMIEVYDMEGRLVTNWVQTNVRSAKINLSFANEASGVYLARIVVGDAELTRRIVIEK